MFVSRNESNFNTLTRFVVLTTDFVVEVEVLLAHKQVFAVHLWQVYGYVLLELLKEKVLRARPFIFEIELPPSKR